jgi:hypothetical protein
MLSQSRRHRRCPRLPLSGRARSVGRLRNRQRQAEARVWQDEIVIHLEQDEGLAQPGVTLTRGGAAPPNRGHSLPQAQI